jgi:hypothetical protein
MEYDPPLDPGIRRYVEVLNEAGIETYESCQGGEGHCYPEPAVRFHGDRSEGFRALAVALQHGFPVGDLRRVWRIEDGEPVGPDWEMTFYLKADVECRCEDCTAQARFNAQTTRAAQNTVQAYRSSKA